MPVEPLMPAWRYAELTKEGPGLFTDAELHAGWHFCPWIGDILVGPGMRQFNECYCHHIDNGNDDA